MKDYKIINIIYKNRERAISLLFFALVFGYFLVRIIVIYSSNIELSEGESNNVWNIINVLNGRSLYMPPDEPPYQIFQYSPLSQLIYIGVLKIFNIYEIESIYRTLRFVNLLFNVLTSFYLFKIIRSTFKINKNLCYWLSFLSLILLTHLNWSVRPDAFATLVSFIALGFSFQAIKNDRIQNVLAAGVFSTISIFSKQDGIQMFFIIPIAYLLLRKFRYGLYYILSALISFSILFFLFNMVYGKVFFDSVIGGIDNGISINYFFTVLIGYFQNYSFYPILIIIISFYQIFKSSNINKIYLSLLCIGTFMFAVGTSIKIGSWMNYFTLFNLLGIVVLGSVVNEISRLILAKFLYLFFVYCFFSGLLFNYISPMLSFSKTEFTNKKEISEKVKKYVDNKCNIYTNDKYLKLFLFDRTIFPNQEYYGVSKFIYNNLDDVKKNLYVVRDPKVMDPILKNILKIDDQDLIKVNQIDSFTMYKYDQSK